MLKLLARDFFRGASQFVVVEPRSPQPRFPLHEHGDFHEIVIVASGSGWHVLNDEPHLISCGEVLYLRTDDRHSFEEVHDLYLTNVLYRPSGALLDADRVRPYLPPADDPCERRYWQVSEDAIAGLQPLLAALARECRGGDSGAGLMAESLFAQLVVTLWRDRFATDGDQLPPSSRFAHVLRYLRQNCTQAIDLDEVAQRFGYSPRNFRRVFREATSTTPHDYLVKLRLGHAMRALRATDDNVTDIAFGSGFNDSNYFSYAFHKLVGMSPSRYRQQIRAPGPDQPGRRRDASS